MTWEDDHELLSRKGYKTKMTIYNQYYWRNWHFLFYSSVISKFSLMNVYYLYNQKEMQVFGLFDFFF